MFVWEFFIKPSFLLIRVIVWFPLRKTRMNVYVMTYGFYNFLWLLFFVSLKTLYIVMLGMMDDIKGGK